MGFALSIPESVWLLGAMAGYSASALAAWRGAVTGSPRPAWVIHLLGIGVVLLAAGLAARWVQLGQGPFLTLYEVLLSNLFSLGLLYLAAYWRFPSVRPGAPVALPVLLVLGCWTLTLSPEPQALPPTYQHPWLWAHVITGKLFLGACLVSSGLAGTLILHRGGTLARGALDLRTREAMDRVAWQFMGVAFVFDTLLLVAGAGWARDAWGRAWDWDPLETWAFVTWLALGIALHARSTFKLPPTLGWWLVLAIFGLAILTFFGLPFVSMAPHKGIL